DVYSLAATALALLTGGPPSGSPTSWGAIECDRIPALERIVRANLATDPDRRDASATAFTAKLARWWGSGLPVGTVTLVLADVGAADSRHAEATADEVASAHRGYIVAQTDGEPLTVACASAHDGLDAARDLAGRIGARVAAVTGEEEPTAGSYRGEVAIRAAQLLETAHQGQVVIDDRTARAVQALLAPEVGLAEMRDGREPAWAVVAPGLSMPSRARTCPYRGLMPYETEDGDLFFGREEVVRSILERVLEGGFMAVVGPSGTGKSSLARAGLAPAFRAARRGSVVVMTPGSDPAAELARVLAPRRPSLLIVDQLEEVFTLCRDEGIRALFLDALLDLGQEGSTSIVVVLRADFYGHCADQPRLAAALAEHQHLLGPMNVDEVRRAIDGPARAAGLRLEAGLIEIMLADVEGEPGALPLLSHALYETWARRDGRVLTAAGYRAAGGAGGAIGHTAEEVFLGCNGREQTLMRQMFLRLTELGETTEDTRRRVLLPELIPDGDSGGEATAVLERLARARLVVVGDNVEVAHEALIREWPRLQGWLAADREALRTLQQLTIAARSWAETGRDEADLYRGPRLAGAIELAGGGRQLSRVEREFVEASAAAQDRELSNARRRTRRLRALLAVVATALVAAVIAGAFALMQRGNARHSATVAQAGRLAAQSREEAGQHPDLALLLALEAERLNSSVDTRGALLGALERGSRIRAWLQGFGSPVEATAFSPDGKLLATATAAGTTVWNTATWRPEGAPLRSSQGGWDWVDFSPDGRTLAIAGGKGRVELWDVASRKELRELTAPGAAGPEEAGVAFVRYSPDGRVIAGGPQGDNHVTLWSAATGRIIGRPITVKPPGSGGAQWVSFSPDSKRIAVPGASGNVGIWEVATGHRIGRPLAIGKLKSDVEAAIFSPDGRTLIASDDSGSVSFVDIATGRPVRPPLSVGDTPAGLLDLSPDGRLLASSSYTGSVFVWDMKTGRLYGSPLTADTSPVNDVTFSPDGRTLVSSHGRSAVVWSMTGEQAIGKPLGGPADPITEVAFSPDGKRLAAGRLDGGTIVYDTATRRQLLRIDGNSTVTAVAFQPDGMLVAVGTLDGHVRFFDPQTGASVGSPLDKGGLPKWQLAFSPDGRLLAVAVDPNGAEDSTFNAQRRQGEVQLWDARSRRRVGRPIEPGGGSVLSLAFNRDGTLLATGGPGRLDLWDVATEAHHGKSMRVADDGVTSVAFDPSGGLVAGGGAIGPVRVWRVSDQRPAFPPLTGQTATTGASFDPTGPFLATSSAFGGTRLWDPATGLAYGDELISDEPASLAPTMDLPPFLGLRNTFSPDGKLLAVPGVDTRAMLWDVDPAAWRRRACAIVGRNLRREEWKLYLPSGTPYRATCPEWPTG
ncbi:MAG: hypothetical protein C5B48_15920, partial [Candidatus Rokuibacteriota bacterium]